MNKQACLFIRDFDKLQHAIGTYLLNHDAKHENRHTLEQTQIHYLLLAKCLLYQQNNFFCFRISGSNLKSKFVSHVTALQTHKKNHNFGQPQTLREKNTMFILQLNYFGTVLCHCYNATLLHVYFTKITAKKEDMCMFL